MEVVINVENINAYPFLHDRLVAFEGMVNNGDSKQFLQQLAAGKEVGKANKFNLSLSKSVGRFLDDLLTDLHNEYYPAYYMREFKALEVSFVMKDAHRSVQLQDIFKLLTLFDSNWNEVV